MKPKEFENPPAWLIAALDQKVEMAKMSLKAIDFGEFQVAIMPLVEPLAGASDEEFARWEQSCDHCKKYVPDDLWSGAASREIHGMPLVIMYGVCTACKELP